MEPSEAPSTPGEKVASTTSAAAEAPEVVSYSFNAPAGHLVPGANVIAASVHQFSGSNDLRCDLRGVGRKRHPCSAQELADECAQERYEASVVPEPQPVPEPEPEPPPPPPKPLSSDMVVGSAPLAVPPLVCV